MTDLADPAAALAVLGLEERADGAAILDAYRERCRELGERLGAAADADEERRLEADLHEVDEAYGVLMGWFDEEEADVRADVQEATASTFAAAGPAGTLLEGSDVPPPRAPRTDEVAVGSTIGRAVAPAELLAPDPGEPAQEGVDPPSAAGRVEPRSRPQPAAPGRGRWARSAVAVVALLAVAGLVISLVTDRRETRGERAATDARLAAHDLVDRIDEVRTEIKVLRAAGSTDDEALADALGSFVEREIFASPGMSEARESLRLGDDLMREGRYDEALHAYEAVAEHLRGMWQAPLDERDRLRRELAARSGTTSVPSPPPS